MTRPLRSGIHGDVGRDLLTGAVPAQEPEHVHGVLHGGNHLLQRHDRHLDRWRRFRHPDVPLVFHVDDRAGLRHGEIHACDAHLDFVELLAQKDPGGVAQLHRLEGRLLDDALLQEQIADLLHRNVQRGALDMKGWPLKQLNDELAKVRLVHLEAVPHEAFVEAGLLGHHRLPLGDEPHAAFIGDPHDVIVRLACIPCPENDRPAGGGILLEFLEKFRQPFDRLGPDRPSQFHGSGRVRKGRHRSLSYLVDDEKDEIQMGTGVPRLQFLPGRLPELF